MENKWLSYCSLLEERCLGDVNPNLLTLQSLHLGKCMNFIDTDSAPPAQSCNIPITHMKFLKNDNLLAVCNSKGLVILYVVQSYFASNIIRFYFNYKLLVIFLDVTLMT